MKYWFLCSGIVAWLAGLFLLAGFAALWLTAMTTSGSEMRSQTIGHAQLSLLAAFVAMLLGQVSIAAFASHRTGEH